jgi:hypothetical protein
MKYSLFRIKVKTMPTSESMNEPVRKQSISGHDVHNMSIAPQLKIDANGSLIIDEER